LNHKNYELSNNKLVIDGKIYTVTQEDRNRCFIEDTEQSKIISSMIIKTGMLKLQSKPLLFVVLSPLGKTKVNFP